jgi:hypothetical protein
MSDIAIPAERAYVADIAGQDVRGTSYVLPASLARFQVF